MTLSDLAIHRPVMAWMLMFGLIIFGGIAFSRMGVSQLPDVDYPVVTVSLTDQGAAPEVMETDIVDIVEDAMMSIQGVRTITSVSRDSSATVTVEFELSRNIDLAQQDVQSKLQAAQRYLPKEMDPAVITKTNPEDQPIIMLSLESETVPPQKLMAYVKDVLKDKFATVSGVGDIGMFGYVDPNMRVWVSDKALNRYNLTVDDVISAISREHYEPPAGFLQAGKKEFNVRLLGEAGSQQEFENLIINMRGGQPNYTPIRLGQVARIEEGLNDIRRLSWGNGKSAVGLGIIKQRGTNEVEVAKAVKRRMKEIQKTLPEGMSLAVNFDNTVFTEQAVGDMNFTLILSALLTALVCWVFLGSWSSTVNVLLAIPTSVVGAFLVLYFAGFTLNTFTLMALSLVIGIVVDDAIMMLENIMRHREMKEGRVHAALVGAREITFAAIATSLAIIAIFLPVAFMQGIMGKFFFQFGVTITVAVALSLLEAITLTPMRCSQFLDVAERHTWFGKSIEKSLVWARDAYRWILNGALQHRWKVVVASLLFFAGSLFTVSKLNKEFLPPVDQSRFMIRMQTPVGSSLAYTTEHFKQAEKFLLKRPEVNRVFVVVGLGNVVNMGFAYVTMKDKGQRGIDPQAGHELTQQEFMGVCRKTINKIPDFKAVCQDLSLRSFSASRGFPIEFTVKGPDWNDLAKYTQQLTTAMGKSGMITDIDTDYQVGQPEMRVIPDRNQATIHGVSVASIGEVINAMIGGVQVGTYPKNGHRYDIRVKLEDDNRSRDQRVNTLYVRNNRGELIPLSQVVRIEEKPTLQSISRKDRERAISVFGNVVAGQSQQAALEKVQELAKQILPSEYHAVIVGSAQTFQESFRDLFMALILGILVAYMILASQYNSYIDPITILMALPFSVSGAFVALLLTHQSLNIYSMIGLILLMGIVKKNSILLVDFTNKVRMRGVASVKEALLEACPIRLRPILMTSIAIIAGALPVALALGPGAESRVPMAVAIIGGVLVSTVLTLLVVPCVYSLLSVLESRHAHQEVLDEAEAAMAADEKARLDAKTKSKPAALPKIKAPKKPFRRAAEGAGE